MDLHTPIDEGVGCVPIRASDPEGLEVIRHSSAHVMADAVQRLFPETKVTFGPAIEDGFYYDFERPDAPFREEDFEAIERAMRKIIQKDTPFRREVISREAAVRYFQSKGEHFKVEHIQTLPEGEEITLYRHGGDGADEWVDLCAGPHVPSTGFLKAIKLTRVAGSYWRGDERNPRLQRIYGTAFDSEEELSEYLKRVEEAKQRDHRKLGKELDLFFFDPLAPAMPFFMPKGAFVYHTLIEYIRSLYKVYGYEEVVTPQVFDPELFQKSGHLEYYRENIYRLWTEDGWGNETEKGPLSRKEMHRLWEKRSFAIKPMNCPAHCMMFRARMRSYRDLPWRVADFGRLHRYERGGVVHGLTRVRTLCQDDAHIFCAEEDVPQEITKFIRLLDEVYRTFKFDNMHVKLATRPLQRIGTDEEWDRSESALEQGLRDSGLPFEISEGEGAFYGPKIEFHIQDALKRSWQLGTIQYDSNLPSRFDLTYVGADGKKYRPLMLHRAVLGSIERFYGIYLEHCAGHFPVWLAPRQVSVLTVTNQSDAYALEVVHALRSAGVRVDLDCTPDKLGAKMRHALLARYPYIAVVGAKEMESRTVMLRSRAHGELGAMDVASFVDRVCKEASLPGSGSFLERTALQGGDDTH
ncbi:threonine--tRNA ligase [Pajaroellobacter abortibovis]|uniref:Threonine--tRNA ligase n=1 Tax=Pajaroellobacter abortibovis TaxID=1882918 RepID=A0A1L6MZA6_9BACT|nr:threonine--tRNA ligase [Pajaroellobacter abortibovis]